MLSDFLFFFNNSVQFAHFFMLRLFFIDIIICLLFLQESQKRPTSLRLVPHRSVTVGWPSHGILAMTAMLPSGTTPYRSYRVQVQDSSGGTVRTMCPAQRTRTQSPGKSHNRIRAEEPGIDVMGVDLFCLKKGVVDYWFVWCNPWSVFSYYKKVDWFVIVM